MMHKPWAHWPTSRGWHLSRRWYRRDDARELNLFVIDPDFDDDNDDLGWVLQRIREHGSISMHPNGDSRDPMFDPVPLFGYPREPNADIGEYMRRHPPPEPRVYEPPKEYINARTIEPLPEPKRPTPFEKLRAAQKAAAIAEKEAEHKRTLQARDDAKAERAQSEMAAEVERACRIPPGYYRFMRPDVPIRKGDGRVWQNMVMVNEEDAGACQHKWGSELWRGDGFVIFRMEKL